nr:recombinase family protein [Streptomyces fulvoviolaceus]
MDHSGQEQSPEDQHRENLAAADEIDAVLGEPYRDIGSASRYAKKSRDDFDRLTDDLRTHAFGDAGDVLMIWENSRGSRKTGEWCTLIDLCEEGGYKIHVTSHGRTYDPTNGRDRKSLLEDAVDSEFESYKTHRRVLRDVTSAAADGKPHGVCPYGYLREYKMIKGRMKPVRQYVDPEAAPNVVELFERLRAGHSFRTIAADWAARGIASRRGTPFGAATLRGMATKVAYIGQRSHHGRTTQATWPAITDDPAFEGTFWAVQAIITDQARRTVRPGGARHAFSSVLRCDVCSEAMTVTYRRAGGKDQPAAYQCHGKGCTRINKDAVDEIVTGEIIAYLSRPEIHKELAADDGESPELHAVRAELARVRPQLAEMEEATPETLAEGRVLARMIEAKEEEIAALEIRERELSTPPALVGVPADDVAGWWKGAEVSTRRAVAALLLVPALLGEVRVRRGRGQSEAERLYWNQESHDSQSL